MNDIVCSGALFYSLDTNRFLFLHRASSKRNNVWGLVGGTNEGTESPWQGLQREIREEIGNVVIKKAIPMETYVSKDNKFKFHTYVCIVEKEFLPILNSEHNGYAWVSYANWPNPLHQGLKNSFNNKAFKNKMETIIEVTEMLR